MFSIFGIIVLLSSSYASRRFETQLPTLQFGELVNQLQPRHLTPPFESHVHPLMMALFQEKHGSLVSNGRSTRHSVRNDLSNKEKKALKRSNTVRSLACLESQKIGNVWNMNFDTTVIPKSERISYAEIQMLGRDVTNEIKELRIKAGAISESIRLTRRRTRKNEKFKLDVTKQIRNIHSWNFINKPDMTYSNTSSADISLIVFSKGDADAAVAGVSNVKSAERTRRDSTRHRARRRKNRSRSKQFRRMTTVDRKNQNEGVQNFNPCRRVPFHVDFESIGWNEWIIYPKRYQAYRCEGQCDVGTMMSKPPTNHAFIQGYFSVVRPGLGIPQPCCVPTKLRPLSLLYFENGDIIKRDHEEMVVEECSCR